MIGLSLSTLWQEFQGALDECLTEAERVREAHRAGALTVDAARLEEQDAEYRRLRDAITQRIQEIEG